ncbi:putative proton-dependent oligopeptide transporter family, MFS transporter superfamily [Helianthus annuus]|nr:putative proton-dependent oligopeptide transporter family, MFS transporter superfamily [Helianthus annuus]
MSFQAILYIQERERELKMREEMNQQTQTRKIKGGLITMPFIIANEAFEKLASYGLVPNMILYLMNDYKFGIAKGTNIIFLWSAATNFAPILGAFLSDSYLGRFLTIAFGSLFSLLVMFTSLS